MGSNDMDEPGMVQFPAEPGMFTTEPQERHDPDQYEDADWDRWKRVCRGTFRALNQGEAWFDIHHTEHRIVDMPVDYRANCMEFLRRQAARLGQQYLWGSVFILDLPSGMRLAHPGSGEPIGPVLTVYETMTDNGGNLDHAMDMEFERLADEIRADPIAWLESTPLMKALDAGVLDAMREYTGARRN